ncbi:hypothetical protein GH714_034819 [Hevea brasiliensis]|uniref:Uncharacterized protein n=1 Tax=Hevea brasiliensis TaxID=3981 RepID=A0A6A6MKE0_HEVBR|nr:hypothetical protein GH714_034819 [Hevea brasiliensis]
MPAFSPKPTRLYNVRSISFPARSHPNIGRIEEELNKLSSWEASSVNAERICARLSALGEIYRCIEDLLNLPLTQQALSQNQEEKWVGEMLDDLIRYLDVCGNIRDGILLMKESVRELQSAIRRSKGGGESSIESNVNDYIFCRKKMKKEAEKSLASLKQKDSVFAESSLSNDHYLSAIVKALSGVLCADFFLSVFSFFFLFGGGGGVVGRIANGGEDGGGEDKVAEEQERGGGEANEERHCNASPVWSRRHCSNGSTWNVMMQTDMIKVEHVIREQNVLAANEFIELFCELVAARLTIIAKQRECPADLKEGIASLVFASPRCSEIPELMAMRKIFEKKYGNDFVSAAIDLRPNCGVNRMLIDKLSVRTPTGEVKLKVMKEIAKEHQIEWDTAESERELLKAPEELIEGPNTFVSATSLPTKPSPVKTAETSNPTIISTTEGAMGSTQFEDTTSAAEAAAESAKQAIAAAHAAAYLANKNFNPGFAVLSGNSMAIANDLQINYPNLDHQFKGPGRLREPQSSSDRSHYVSNEEARSVQMDGEQIYRRHSYNETRPIQMDGQNVHRRHSYNASSPNSEIKFDESDCDEEIEMEDSPAGIYPPPPERWTSSSFISC